MGEELARRETARAFGLSEDLPGVGEWFWIAPREPEPGEPEVEDTGEPPPLPLLMCVEHVASNHVVFTRHEGRGETEERLRFEELYTRARPAPEWKERLETEMAEIRAAMEEQARLLRDEAHKKNALPDPGQVAAPTAETCMLPAVRVLDPVRQKADLVALKERLPVVTKELDRLAEEFAGVCKNLCLAEQLRLRQMVGQLRVLEDKIFTLEVYAGLQEEVRQIAEGEPAPITAKLAVRQTLLYMDEETLIDYGRGGMDFTNLRAFDKWVTEPANLARVLPEPRGIVAFRVRRERKDYGPAKTIWDAWAHMEMNEYNMATYLLIRNGGNVYRIASAVDFSPRLIPLRDEFEGHFEETHRRWGRNWPHGPDEYETELIGPDHFGYDKRVEDLKDRLKHYNRVVVLLQGLLDRSEVFHPHAPINLATEADLNEWLHLIRDEEDGIGYTREKWEDYIARLNGLTKAGDTVLIPWKTVRRDRRGAQSRCAEVITVDKVRKGTKADVVPHRADYTRGNYYVRNEGRDEKHTVGVPGIEVSWPWKLDYFSDDVDPSKRCREWFPLSEIFNFSTYHLGDFRTFLCDRIQKGAYLKWAPLLLEAERWHLDKLTARKRTR